MLLSKTHVPQELGVHLQQRQKTDNEVSRSDQSMEVVHNSKIYSLKATQHNRAERQKGLSTVDIQVCGLTQGKTRWDQNYFTCTWLIQIKHVAERPGCKSNIHKICIISQTYIIDIVYMKINQFPLIESTVGLNQICFLL